MRGSPLERFLAKVEITSGCWLWTGGKSKFGYGSFGGPKPMGAHKFIYQQAVGQVPKGMHLDHLCRNPSCVRPSHLEAVTPRENVRRGTAPAAKNARKTHCNRGHELNGENLDMENGRRRCITCRRQLRGNTKPFRKRNQV